MNVGFLLFIRVVSITIAAAWGADSAQYGWIYWLQAHLGHPDALSWRGYNSASAQDIGPYLTAFAAVPIALFAIPRYRWGPAALSWCYLIMAALLHSHMYGCLRWVEQDTFVMTITCFARYTCYASPALIIGLVLRYRFVKEALRMASPSSKV
jgi:hypothetical protein